MNLQNIKAVAFTKEDLSNVDFKAINEKGLRRIGKGLCYRWWNSCFSFNSKDGRKLAAVINSYDESFILHSEKYGDFNSSFLGKILADLMQDNDELYIINRELQKMGDEWCCELNDGGYEIVNDRFNDIIFNELNCKTDQIAEKVLKMAIDGKKNSLPSPTMLKKKIKPNMTIR